MSRSSYKLRLWSGLCLGLLVLAGGIGWHQVRARAWRAELSLAREAMNARRYGSARERLARLAEHWTNHGEVFLLLGECELQRGRREEALAAWAKVPPTAPSFALAARFRASNLIAMGRYSPAEAILLQALENPGQPGSLRPGARAESIVPARRADRRQASRVARLVVPIHRRGGRAERTLDARSCSDPGRSLGVHARSRGQRR